MSAWTWRGIIAAETIPEVHTTERAQPGWGSPPIVPHSLENEFKISFNQIDTSVAAKWP